MTTSQRERPPCGGTRTVTEIIQVADAVRLNDQACPGCPDCTPGPPTPEPRTTVGHELGAEEASSEVRFWLRQCQGGVPGALVDYLGATRIMQENDVLGTLTEGLRWNARGTQDPHAPERQFTLTPLTDAQAAAWIRQNQSATR